MISLIGCENKTEYVDVQKAAVYPQVEPLVLAKGLKVIPNTNDTYASELLRLNAEIESVNSRYSTLHNQFPKIVD